jgi:hypothetical protein
MDNGLAVKLHDKIAPSQMAQAKIAHTIPEAVQVSGLSRSTICIAIREGSLAAKKCGARMLVLDADLRRFLSNLPHLDIGETLSDERPLPSAKNQRDLAPSAS